MQISVHYALASEEERQFRGYGVESTEMWRVMNFEIMHSLLLRGIGWGVVPLSRVAEDLATGRLVVLQIDRWKPRKGAITVPLVVVQASDRPHVPAGQWLFQKFAETGGLASRPTGQLKKLQKRDQQDATSEYQNGRSWASRERN